MELAALQLAVCLVQVVFIPHDSKKLKQRMEKPLTEDEYETGIAKFADMFVLDHLEQPFMQTRGVKGKEVSLQKFFIGLPEKASTSPFAHAFFNEVDEVEKACPSCVAIALFQQATNGVSLGGRFFTVGLKGASPVTTLIVHQNLRQRIWVNLLSEGFLAEKELYSTKPEENIPTWKIPIRIKKKTAESAHKIGLLRGLFWQPARVELRKGSDSEIVCDVCGVETAEHFVGFCQEPLPYKRDGFWRHPHSPVDVVQKSYFKFWSQVPTWANLSQFFWEKKSSDEGQAPALVITQYNKVWHDKPITISIGGYISSRENTEKIEARRHEMYSLPAGWENKLDNAERLIKLAIEVKALLRGIIYGLATDKGPGDLPALFRKPKNFNKSNTVESLTNRASELYMQSVETVVHEILRTIKWNEMETVIQDFKKRIENFAIEAFTTTMEPYNRNEKFIPKIILKQNELHHGLKQIFQ